MIEAILKAARRPCPKVVPAIRWVNRKTGVVASAFPPGGPDAWAQAQDGFAYTDGPTTYRARYIPTHEAAIRNWEESEDRKAADFRAVLEAMTDEQIEDQAAYWFREEGD